MTKTYRVQPAGLDLGSHRSETSNGNADRGVHVMQSREQVLSAINGWCRQDYRPEIVTIECESSDVRDNGDYEGWVLVGNRGKIVARETFADWSAIARVARDF